MKMSLFRPFLFGMCIAMLSCAEKIDLETPPETKIFSVTDMTLTADGGHLILLSGNFNRRYNFGRVSVYDLATREVVSSVLVDSIGGHLLLSPEEDRLYVTTREWNRLHFLTVSRGGDNAPLLSYGLTKGLDDVSYGVRLEPYALAARNDGELIFVTHLRNGEVRMFRRGDTSLTEAGTFELANGVTAIVEDASHGIFLTAHKDSERLGTFRIIAEKEDAVSVSVGTIDLPIPMPGIDVRGLVSSGETSSYYLSYRNADADGEESPLLIKIALVEHEETGLRAERRWAIPLDGELAEAAVIPCGTGSEIIFVASPDDSELFAVKGENGTLFARIELDDCTPYQLHARSDDPLRRLFVGCFAEDRVLVVDGDCESETFLTVMEEIP